MCKFLSTFFNRLARPFNQWEPVTNIYIEYLYEKLTKYLGIPWFFFQTNDCFLSLSPLLLKVVFLRMYGNTNHKSKALCWYLFKINMIFKCILIESTNMIWGGWIWKILQGNFQKIKGYFFPKFYWTFYLCLIFFKMSYFLRIWVFDISVFYRESIYITYKKSIFII